ncbi:MAG: alpha/beta hydrolase [Chitinophagaceae bacterium]|nr:alpha/beta hydrolase [Chitinophagaceae bacterium]
MHREGQMKWGQSAVGYRLSGQGPVLVLCFHGYGESAAGFDFLGKYAGTAYCFLAIDLPWHGRTEWQDGDLKPAVLQTLINEICEKETIQAQQQYLMGFSMGGRIALALYEINPVKYQRLILLAPDGLKVNPWYRLATRSWAGNRFFALTMSKPGWFLGLLKLMNRFGMVNASIYKFVHFYIGDKQVRALLYKRWTCLRLFSPSLQQIRQAALRHHTEIRLLYGIHDRIIRPGRGEKFIRGLEAQARLRMIHSGHQLLHEKHVTEILPALQ